MTVEDLQSIPALPIPMVSDGLKGDALNELPDYLNEWSRITGGLTIPVEIVRWGGWERIVEHAMEFLAENDLKVSWSFHPLNHDFYMSGKAFPLKPQFSHEELDYLTEFDEHFSDVLSFADDAEVQTLAVLFDCERFWLVGEDVAASACLAAYHALAKSYCPDAYIDWWQAESIEPAPRADGSVFWQRKRWLPKAMESDTKPCVTLQHLWNMSLTLETISRCGKGGAYWVGLGGGYDGPEPATEEGKRTWFKQDRAEAYVDNARWLGSFIAGMTTKPTLLGLSGMPRTLDRDVFWTELAAFAEGMSG